MPLRVLLIVTVSVLLAVSAPALYVVTVQRGPMGGRELLAWEVAAHGEVPGRFSIYDTDARAPQYPRALQWLAPAFADLHAVDVYLRWEFWHEEYMPEFDEAPDFELVR